MYMLHGIIRCLTCMVLIMSMQVWAGVTADLSGSFSTYSLNAGDKIKITIFGESEMDVESRLTDAGSISYPLLGEIRVKGMTVSELQSYLYNNLIGSYFINPKVNVSVIEYRKFFVNGEVKSPGGFAYEPGLTSEKIVALAGGFTQRAAENDIVVTRIVNGKRVSKKLRSNEPVLPGDIITVEESFF